MAHRKVQPGRKIKDSPVHQSRYINDTVDVVNAWKEGRVGSAGRPASARRSTNQVEIKNLTGSDRQLGDVVELGGHLLTEVTEDYPWLEGNTFTGTERRKFAVLVKPIPSGTIDTAQADGVCIARVNVTDTNHTHAIPVAGYYTLSSGPIGPVEFLLPPTSTGEQLLWVRIDQAENFCYAVSIGIPIAAEGTGNVTLPDGRVVTATNWSRDTDLEFDDQALCFEDLVSGTYYLVKSGQADKTRIVRVTAADPGANCLWPGKLLSIVGTPSGGCTSPFTVGADCLLLVLNETGGSWSSDKFTLKVGDTYIGRHVFSVTIPEVGSLPVYAIRHSPKAGTVLYKGFLTTPLAITDANASVNGLESYTEEPAPDGTIDAANFRKFAGDGGDKVIVIQDNSVSPPTYDLLAVEWDELERVTDVEWTSPNLKEHKQKFLGKETGDPEDPETILTASEQTVVTNVDYNSGTHALRRTINSHYVFSAGTPVVQNILVAQAVGWVEDVTYDSESGLNMDIRSAWMLGEEGITTPYNIVGLTTASAVYQVQWDAATLSATGETFKYLGNTPSIGSPSTLFSTTTAELVLQVEVDGTTIQADYSIVRVFTVTAGAQNVEIHEGTECDAPPEE